MTDYVITDQSGQANVLAAIRDLDMSKSWRVEIRRGADKRTLSQNALYWRWCEILSQYLGYEKEEIHDMWKQRFLPEKELTFGAYRQGTRTTTRLTTAEMAEYMDKCYRMAAQEIEFALPLPDDRD